MNKEVKKPVNKALENAIKDAGIMNLCWKFRIHPNTVQNWLKIGRLPRSDYSGETNYADGIIEQARLETSKEYTREQLLPPLGAKKKKKK